ncbi:uncharacterized protein [Haliotis asinina]|uniref:uncharacterized protein n=1 Tax=Haliotis asinina TaxID=109174 RepID=UPI003531968A
MTRLSPEERERAIGMLQLGATAGDVSRTFHRSVVTVRNLRRRCQQTDQTSDRPRTGRPRVTTAQEDRHLRLLQLRNRFLTVTSSAATALGYPVGRRTVTRRLRAHGIRAKQILYI